jgi:hypothetical protein
MASIGSTQGLSASLAAQQSSQTAAAARTGDFLKMLQEQDASADLGARDEQAVKSAELKDAFTQFVGQTLFGQTLAAMRKTVDKPAYFHGGHAEEVFQQQMDQHLVEHLTTSAADRFIEPMYELFSAQRNMQR